MSARNASVFGESAGKRRCLSAAVLIMVTLGTWRAVAGEDTVTLLEEAQVRGSKVLLGEVAAIEGVNAEALAAIEVIAAPMPGAAKQVHASLVESRLRGAGFDPKNVSIKGSSRVRATTAHATISREALAESLRQHILLEMPWDLGDTQVDVPLPLNDIIAPDGDVDIFWKANPQYRYVGAGAFSAEILVDGQVFRTLQCKAIVEPYVNVVTALSDIPRGRSIGPRDLDLRKIAVSAAPQGAVTRIEDIIGMVATKTIFPGQTVTTRMVDMPVIVRRSQMVPVEVQSGAVQLQGRAVAMSDARAGDLLTCMNPNSKEQFLGLLRKDGVVVVQ